MRPVTSEQLTPAAAPAIPNSKIILRKMSSSPTPPWVKTPGSQQKPVETGYKPDADCRLSGVQPALAGFRYEPGVLTQGGASAASLNLELLLPLKRSLG
jgi:hypothetical protein